MRGGTAARGGVVQVAPIKPTLKAPGTKRLKLKHDELLSNFAFKFTLRRFTVECGRVCRGGCTWRHGRAVHVDPMKPKLKAPGTKLLKLEHDPLL